MVRSQLWVVCANQLTTRGGVKSYATPTHQQASMYTYTIVGGGALPTSPQPLNTCSHNTATRRPPTPLTHNNTQQQYTTALGYIKLPMYQLFLWRLYLMVLRSATSLLGTLEGVGPENRDFFGPWNGTSKASAIWAQKSPLPMPLVMMMHSSKPLRTAP